VPPLDVGLVPTTDEFVLDIGPTRSVADKNLSPKRPTNPKKYC
jgi:hypothetical protein